MPSEIEIYSDIVLFGIRVIFQSDDQAALDIASSLYPDWSAAKPLEADSSIYVVLKSYGVNPPLADLHCVKGSQLAIIHDGVTASADGEAGRGCCEFFRADAALADMINTVVLFLVGHAGRVPLHASAVILDGIAIVFAGRSGSGKSTLALAASQAGLPVLSDDTVFIQTSPKFRLWSLAGPIHVFEKDAPPGVESGERVRAGRRKKSLPNLAPSHSADRAILCVLARGDKPALEPLSQDEAVAALTDEPEPGYEFYGQGSKVAARALAGSGAWRLTLSANPAEAIALARRTFASGPDRETTFHSRYLNLIATLESRFAVTDWRSGDVDLWPLVRLDLYLDMHRRFATTPPSSPRPWPMGLAARILKPLINLWRARHHLARLVWLPKPAHAIFLGDGESLDKVDGVFRDRCCEPIIAALEQRRQNSFLMQSGGFDRQPWRRPTFAANVIEAWGSLAWPSSTRRMDLPDHRAVTEFLAGEGIDAPSLSPARLARRARQTSGAAWLFERLLKVVRPKFAFVVSFYAGLGPAFVLACRRQGVFCIDLQRAPVEGAPMACAEFSKLPRRGLSTLPALFWTWTEQDAETMRQAMHGSPWHGSLHGGHPQSPFLLDEASTHEWDEKFPSTPDITREILVAFQPLGGFQDVWDALAAAIESAPSGWRWWLRRHPASRPCQDVEFRRLLSILPPQRDDRGGFDLDSAGVAAARECGVVLVFRRSGRGIGVRCTGAIPQQGGAWAVRSPDRSRPWQKSH